LPRLPGDPAQNRFNEMVEVGVRWNGRRFFGLQEKRLVRLPKSSKEQDKVAPPLVRLALDIGLRRFDETASATMYLGEINHRRKSFPAEHEPIIEKEVFDAVQNILNENPNRHVQRGSI
jgi:hypothetical protein